jgi:hypothetical protein
MIVAVGRSRCIPVIWASVGSRLAVPVSHDVAPFGLVAIAVAGFDPGSCPVHRGDRAPSPKNRFELSQINAAGRGSSDKNHRVQTAISD